MVRRSAIPDGKFLENIGVIFLIFRKKVGQKITDLQEVLNIANGKIATLEKVKHKLHGDLEDAEVDVERVRAYARRKRDIKVKTRRKRDIRVVNINAP